MLQWYKLSRVKIDTALLVALPWLLSAANPNWLYTPISSMDSWIYQGYFNNLGPMVRAFPGTYYSARLAYTLPGWLCYRLSSPTAANLVLHMSLYYAAVFAIYGILRLHKNPWATLVAVATGLYPFFVGAMGRDYIDGAGISYTLISILCLTIAMKVPKMRLWALGCSGIFLSCAIHTTIFLALVIPFLLVYYRPFSVNDFGFVVLGAIGVTLTLGLVSVGLGGRFLFFNSSLYYVARYAGTPVLGSGSGWYGILRSPWLIALGLIFLLSFKSRGRASLGYVIMLVEYSLVNWRCSAILESQYYDSYLIPIAALALAEFLETISAKRAGAVVAIVLVSMLPLNSIYHIANGTRQQLETVYRAEQQIKSTNLYFWYNLQEDETYRAIACTHLWSYRLVDESFPYLMSYQNGPGTRAKAHIKSGMNVVVLSRSSKALDDANRELANVNLRASLSKEIQVDDITLTFISIGDLD